MVVSDAFLAMMLSFIPPIVFWTLVFGSENGSKNFELSGIRRFYYDWDFNSPIRFVNPQLLEAFERENQSEAIIPTKLVNNIARSSFDFPKLNDCIGGICIGVIVVIAMFILVGTMLR